MKQPDVATNEAHSACAILNGEERHFMPPTLGTGGELRQSTSVTALRLVVAPGGRQGYGPLIFASVSNHGRMTYGTSRCATPLN